MDAERSRVAGRPGWPPGPARQAAAQDALALRPSPSLLRRSRPARPLRPHFQTQARGHFPGPHGALARREVARGRVEPASTGGGSWRRVCVFFQVHWRRVGGRRFSGQTWPKRTLLSKCEGRAETEEGKGHGAGLAGVCAQELTRRAQGTLAEPGWAGCPCRDLWGLPCRNPLPPWAPLKGAPGRGVQKKKWPVVGCGCHSVVVTGCGLSWLWPVMAVACPMITLLSLPSPFSNGDEGTWLVLCPARQAVELKQQPAGTLYTPLPPPLHLHPNPHVLHWCPPGCHSPQRKGECVRGKHPGRGWRTGGRPPDDKATSWCGSETPARREGGDGEGPPRKEAGDPRLCSGSGALVYLR